MFFFTTLTISILLLRVNLIFGHPSSISTREVTNTSKAGLAWSNGDGVDVRQYQTTDKVSWYYSWSPYPINTDLEFVPMLWGPNSVGPFTSTINATLSKLAVRAVLGMNEPQERGQSNMTPEAGAQMWKTYLEPLRAHGVRLGSPAPSSAPSGKIWLQDFLTACAGGCTVDFIALHYYDVNATQFIEYLEDYHNTFQRPLWVTEWACQNYNDVKKQCSQDDVILFLNKTQTFMDNATFVERYAWFGAMKDMGGVNQADALMYTNGKINALGQQYIGAKVAQTTGSGNADGPNAPGGGGGIIINRGVLATLDLWINIVSAVLVSSALLIPYLL